MKSDNTDSNEVRIGAASLLILVLGVIAVFSMSSSDTFILNKIDSEKYVPYEGADSNVNLGSYNLTASYANVSNQVAQYHREKTIDTNTTDTWQNVSFDTRIDEEITRGYNLTDQNQSVKVDFSGIVKVQGKVTVINNATNSETQKIALRIVFNGSENRCTQVSSNTQRVSGNYNTEIITGTTNVTAGEKFNLQYQVDDTDLDISGDPVFDHPVAVSLNFEKVSK